MWWGDIKTLNIWKDKPVNDEWKRYAESDISVLDLSRRAYNCLKRADCNTINSAIKLIHKDELRRIRGLGETTRNEIEDKINKYLNK